MRDLRDVRPAAGPADLEALETDVLAGFVLARASAGLTDGTIRSDVSNLEQIRVWFERPALNALRSLFAWAQKNKRSFRNPTTRIHNSKPQILWPLLQPNEFRQTIEAATTPQARLLVAFAAIYATKPGQLRAMHLNDVDLPNRRVRIDGRDRPLDELTHQILSTWLDHRRAQWPNTANTHLLISQRTAVGLGPVSAPWTNLILRGLPATLGRLGIDRKLEEAFTSGADPLHIAAVFDVRDTTAIRYAVNAAHLLPRQYENDHRSPSRTPVSEPDTERSGPLSSP